VLRVRTSCTINTRFSFCTRASEASLLYTACGLGSCGYVRCLDCTYDSR
jgi:hypothetical protein